MYINVFYQYNINIIGGIETFLYELAKLSNAHKRDLTIIYRVGDPAQINRLRRYCRVIKYQEIVEKPIKCKRAFFNYAVDIINDIEADEYIQIVHADFKSESLVDYPVVTSEKITQYYAVSENNAKSFRELTGRDDIEVLYNPITIEPVPRIMTLVSAQRLTPEKGGKRLEELAQLLDKHNISYIWHIFSNDRLSYTSPNIIYHKVTLDIRKWLNYADYTVLLSDTEGFPYTAYESLLLGTPLIITELPILSELGANEDNSIILKFDLSNLDVDEIYKKAGTFKFNYSAKPTKWLQLLKGKSTYNFKICKIVAIDNYFDKEEQKEVALGDVYEVPMYRAEYIVNKGFAKYYEVNYG